MSERRACIAIDLKSFYASVECVSRGLDPLCTNLVVADESRTEKTICLAVSPSLKSFGISGRARLFEVISRLKEVNAERLRKAPKHQFTGSSSDIRKLNKDPSLKVDFLIAVPRMAEYMRISSEIISVYLNYIAPEDMHVYSVDEVFLEATPYLNTYGLTHHELAVKMIHEVFQKTGITATAGIGTNLYLAKIAMDIEAKHIEPDDKGVRIAELNEMSYRRLLWEHKPLRDFWRVGPAYERKLHENGLYTMGDIARCSLGKAQDFHNEDLLYRLFGVNAELLIDHAWGYEPCTIADIKAYKPENNSISSAQVLRERYDAKKAQIIIQEMADSLVLSLVDKGLLTDQIVLHINYDKENAEANREFMGEIKEDRYGRKVPKDAHGSVNLGRFSSSTRLIIQKTLELYDDIMDTRMTVRRLSITANHIKEGTETLETERQLDLFTDPDDMLEKQKNEQEKIDKEKRLQQAELAIKKRFGKNALIRGLNLQEGATGIERNKQTGGHKS